MKAIETIYKGYRFRSRLEARWAVFFDAIGMKYEYEPEGYILSDGTKYLPDFYLPDVDTYVEVKHKNAIDINCSDDYVSFDSKDENSHKYLLAASEISKEHKYLLLQGEPYEITCKKNMGDGSADLFFTGICFGKLQSLFDESFTCKGGQKCNDCEHWKLPATYPIIGFGRNFLIALVDPIPDVVPLDKTVELISLINNGKDVKKTKEDIGKDLVKSLDASIKARQARFEHGEKP